MAVGGLIQGYKRWNPVHPTYGAFWGVGVGLGCGVGWGPGFGHEVVGFVGSGCGVGLSMGVTLVGVGVGLPASGLACVPCNVVTGAGQGVRQMTRVIAPMVSSFASRTWQAMDTKISMLDHQLRLRSQRTGDGSFREQSIAPDAETMERASGDDSHDFNRRSRVRFSASSSLPQSSSQDVRSECPHEQNFGEGN
uniref:Uncharacterized protein n=1 Tax=Physcomitrium patens TaxID=3218 RepID=A0A2K1IXN0_PHYPA|nr:hypothetical protein PHYPA_023850 [Physcomitrium patens]